ncbi:MAG: DUF4926 domain-containing protein [Bacteroidia bacterium]|nr:DUF4926 domain-containing protein [Bacteroidia bacterium]
MKVLDVVAMLHDLFGKKLLKGQVGTVVEQLDENVFEVEFVNTKGETIALEEVHADNLFLLHFEIEKV